MSLNNTHLTWEDGSLCGTWVWAEVLGTLHCEGNYYTCTASLRNTGRNGQTDFSHEICRTARLVKKKRVNACMCNSNKNPKKWLMKALVNWFMTTELFTLVPKPTPLLSSSQRRGTSSPSTETSRCCRHWIHTHPFHQITPAFVMFSKSRKALIPSTNRL